MKYTIQIENIFNADFRLGFADHFFIKICSPVNEDQIKFLKKNLEEEISFVGRGDVQDEFTFDSFDTIEGAEQMKKLFEDKYKSMKCSIKSN